jgi:hypothetical protein
LDKMLPSSDVETTWYKPWRRAAMLRIISTTLPKVAFKSLQMQHKQYRSGQGAHGSQGRTGVQGMWQYRSDGSTGQMAGYNTPVPASQPDHQDLECRKQQTVCEGQPLKPQPAGASSPGQTAWTCSIVRMSAYVAANQHVIPEISLRHTAAAAPSISW